MSASSIPGFCSDDELRVRTERAKEIEAAFQMAGIGVTFDPAPDLQFAHLFAFPNHRSKDSRQILVLIGNCGECRVYISKQSSHLDYIDPLQLALGDFRAIGSFPADTDQIGLTIVERVLDMCPGSARSQEPAA